MLIAHIIDKLFNQRKQVVVEELEGKIENLEATNVFAEDELEIKEGGSFGSNAKSQIKSTIFDSAKYKDLEDAVNGESTVEVTITEDDWDEDEEKYVKHIEINNAYVKIIHSNLSHVDAYLTIYNPYFKGISFRGASYFDAYVLTGLPEERYIETISELSVMDLSEKEILSIFNGFVDIAYIGIPN